MLSKPCYIALFTMGFFSLSPSQAQPNDGEPPTFPIHVVHLQQSFDEEVSSRVEHHFLSPKDMNIQILWKQSDDRNNPLTPKNCHINSVNKKDTGKKKSSDSLFTFKPEQNSACVLTRRNIEGLFTGSIQEMHYQLPGNQPPVERPFSIILITSHSEAPVDYDQISPLARHYLDFPLAVEKADQPSIFTQWLPSIWDRILNYLVYSPEQPIPPHRYRCREYHGSFSKKALKQTINPDFETITLEILALTDFEQEVSYLCQLTTNKANNQQHTHDET